MPCDAPVIIATFCSEDITVLLIDRPMTAERLVRRGQRVMRCPAAIIDTGTRVLAAVVSVMCPRWPGSLWHRHDQHSLYW
jgi:hypothetical protein